MRRIPAWLRTVCGYAPVTVLLVAGVSGTLLAHGVTDASVEPSPGTFLNPAWYLLSMVVHDGWSHFTGNMWLFVPFGVTLTVLTSDRHALGVVLVSHGLSNLVWVATTVDAAVGTSGAAFGVVAATLVRATGHAFRNASGESLQAAVAGLLAPFLFAFFLVAVLAGRSHVAHLAHFFAFLFGGAMEAMYVFADHEDDAGERRVTNPLRE